MLPKMVGNNIIFDKETNELDNFVISFIEILDSLQINYVIVSGYVAILFGRSRATEDIDVLIEPISKERFSELYATLIKNGYWIINSTTEKDAFEILNDRSSIRVAENNKIIPNMEVKFVKDEIERYSLNKKIRVEIGDKTLFLSPLEMQIAYKFYLSGEKDIEDAYFLFSLFKDKLNNEELKSLIKSLKAEKTAKKHLEALYAD
ncbi:MAG: hypothetical protein ABIF85_00455 [Nanoarchaeota archaeon]|nr:hypothetical protein [Nanoarchaeota archaeon]MBU4300653.1 hypothetical protein [Nanoarchaeota archaeon]MBU4452485.1 hypothetical protein [Nanoarchaeota archaeon]MCG2723438.1 hypothetical protein [archaeon]